MLATIVSATPPDHRHHPGHAAGTVAVVATNAAGASNPLCFTYGAPVVAAVSPNAGPTTGGTVVTITGTGLLNATSVAFGATAASSFTVNSDTSITATTARPRRARWT